jgi:hypothetical protein
MTYIFDGPGLNPLEPEASHASELPFAWKLQLALSKLGVAIQQYKPMEVGASMCPEGFTQLVITSEVPEKLAIHIKARFGTNIQFAELAIPRVLAFVGYEQTQGVWMRRLVDYDVRSDTFIQRWDIRVRAIDG